MPASRVGGDSEIVSWIDGATRASAVKVVSRSTNSCAWVSATGATSRAVAASALTNWARPVSGAARFLAHRLEVLEHARQLAQRLVQRRPASGERVAELEQVLLDRDPGRGVERAQHLVDLDRLRMRVADRHDRAGRVALVGAALIDLQVLEPERRAGADDEGRVDRELLDVLVELQVEAGADVPVLALLRLDRLDHADPDAADADLVGGHQQVGVGDHGRDPVGGDERKAVVGVVGEEDGEDDHHHGDRADHRRARRQRCAPAPHRLPRLWCRGSPIRKRSSWRAAPASTCGWPSGDVASGGPPGATGCGSVCAGGAVPSSGVVVSG